jgi:hypothetical protein
MQIPARISSSRISGDQLQQVLIEAQTHCGTTLSCECIAGGLGGNGGEATTGATWQSHSNARGGWLARGWRAVTGWSRLQAPSSGRRPKGSQASTAPAGQKSRHGISALISFRAEPGGWWWGVGCGGTDNIIRRQIEFKILSGNQPTRMNGSTPGLLTTINWQ